MGFDWTKYLELAECISENAKDLPHEEACYRASVSRAYYAAFCTTRVFICEVDRVDKAEFEGGGHRKVRDHLKNSGDKLRRKIANQLERFHFDRIRADYHDNIRGEKPRSMAFKSIAAAKKILSEIEALSKEPKETARARRPNTKTLI